MIKPKIEEKVWGYKYPLYQSSYVCIDKLYIKAGGFCSYHYHDHKFNRFHVISGLLAIQVEDKNFLVGPEGDYEIFDIIPGKKHQFCASIDTIVIEIVYVKVLQKDIIRLTEGGLNDT